MKMTFQMVGKDETTVKVTAEIKTHKRTLTREETKQIKDRLENGIHGVLREQGFNVSQIKLVRAA